MLKLEEEKKTGKRGCKIFSKGLTHSIVFQRLVFRQFLLQKL